MKQRSRSNTRKLIGAASLVLIVVSVAVVGLKISFQGRALTPAGQIFAPTSFWYQSVPNDAPVRADSQVLADNLQQQIIDNYGGAEINTTSFAGSVYVAQSNTPTQAVKFNNCQNKAYPEPGLLAQWAAVPIPPDAVPAGGTDKEMIIYQPSTDTIWEFWIMEKRTDGWYGCWGGRMDNVSKSNGIWPFPYGTTAAGLSLVGGQISLAEAQAGVINHVIGVAVPASQPWPNFHWPATRTDGYVGGSPIAQGQRMRLNPTVNVEALDLPPYGKMMARAMQKYGIVIWDTAGAVSFRGENPTQLIQQGQPNPYTTLFAGRPSYEQLRNFPWKSMQALPLEYGRYATTTTAPAPAPTPTPTPAPAPSPAPTPSSIGAYKITGPGTSCLDVSGKATVDGTQMQVWTCYETLNQNFDLTAAGEIRPKHTTNKCVDISANGTADGTKIQLWTCNGGAAQKWSYTATGEFKNPNGKCLDIQYGVTSDGTPVQLWTCNGSPAQKWNLQSLAAIAPVLVPGDANKDNRVNALDLSILITRDGQTYPDGDFNGDGTIGAADLAILLSKWTW